tara:strand:- start:40 stop:489 length:450 start_codon:yes stop_codon:yes gene_type:complete
MIEKLRNMLIESANIMFDDSKNDLRALPKTVRLQILIVLSFVWSTVFSLYVFNITTFIGGWLTTVVAHIGVIFATYLTFKIFHTSRKDKKSVFETGNYSPVKIFAILFVIFFIFIFTKGIDVLTRTNSYTIEYDGPDKTTLQRIKDFVK